MADRVEVVVIGAGSAGLAAVRQISKISDNFLLIDHGPLGTTCARIGCMPSKALLAIAKDLHRAARLAAAGLTAGPHACDIPAVLAEVRRKRDRFAGGMVEATRNLAGERLITGSARLLGPDRVLVDDREIRCNKIILATGSRPLIPPAWQPFADKVLTADTLFEQTDLPPRLALVGLGVIGLEIGQALARLGLQVTGFGRNPHLGGLRDPQVNRAALAALQQEFPLHVGSAAEPAATEKGILVRNGSQAVEVDAVIAGLGVTPNVEGLGLETLGVELDRRGLPPFDPNTLQVANLPVFLTGDANGQLSLLHEAQDEGFIAGSNALASSPQCYRRRTPLRICFSDPQIAAVGLTIDRHQGLEVVTGRADFGAQSRAVAEGRNAGLLHLYVEKSTARLIGAEMAVPEGEHLAQLLALAVQHQLTVQQLLNMPFYHPTVEEGLRTALRDAATQLTELHPPIELSLCDSCPERPLC